MSNVIDHRPRFYQVQNEVLDDYGAEMEPNGIAIYNALCRFANEQGECYPSVKTIGEKVGIKSKTTVRTYLKRLKDLGLISIEYREEDDGDHSTNIYHLHFYVRKGGSSNGRVGHELGEGRSNAEGGVGQSLTPKNTNIKNTNLTIRAGAGGEEDLTSKAEEDASSLMREAYHLIGKFPPSIRDREGRETLALASSLVERYGFPKCMRELGVMREGHLNLIEKGDRNGVKAPLRYLSTVLEKREEEAKGGDYAPDRPPLGRDSPQKGENYHGYLIQVGVINEKFTDEGHKVIDGSMDIGWRVCVDENGKLYKSVFNFGGEDHHG